MLLSAFCTEHMLLAVLCLKSLVRDSWPWDTDGKILGGVLGRGTATAADRVEALTGVSSVFTESMLRECALGKARSYACSSLKLIPTCPADVLWHL